MKKHQVLAALSMLSLSLTIGTLILFYFKELTQQQTFINILNTIAGIVLSIYFGRKSQNLLNKQDEI